MTTGVYPPMFHYLRKYGMYVFRFYKNYGWRYVIINDRLPCYNKAYGVKDLVFGRCRSTNEFWVPLIEKAYAKLHNCYEALISGFIDDGLTDMTAFAQTKIIFKKRGSKTIKLYHNTSDKGKVILKDEDAKEELWKLMKRANQNNSLMGCSALGSTEGEISIDDVPCGVLSGHAYSVIDVIEIEVVLQDPDGKQITKMERLVRCRNPWGKKEWNGAWSDGSEELNDNMKALNGYIMRYNLEQQEKFKDNPALIDEKDKFNEDSNDGTFLISFEDWR